MPEQPPRNEGDVAVDMAIGEDVAPALTAAQIERVRLLREAKTGPKPPSVAPPKTGA